MNENEVVFGMPNLVKRQRATFGEAIAVRTAFARLAKQISGRASRLAKATAGAARHGSFVNRAIGAIAMLDPSRFGDDDELKLWASVEHCMALTFLEPKP